MSGVAGLFSTESKQDASVSNLFASASSGPVKRSSIKQRTVIVTKSQESNDDEKEQEEEEEESSEEEEEEKEQEELPKKKRKLNDEDDDLESKYLEKILDDKADKKEEKENSEEDEENESSDSDSEDEQEEVSKASKTSSAKSIDFKESEIEKAERTIFVGNLSSTVITSKKDYKSFKKFFQQYGEVESIRFRSIAFNEALPRKVAFVKQKLHSSRDSVNSYIVFKTKESARESLKSNGEVLLDFHLRVDSVSHPAKIDNKRAIFVGNLDFEEKEEELWNIFKGCGDIEFVRIVRDAKTNVGKGFGYVQFKDFTSVSKALLLHEKKLGEKKRKLRITRSKKITKTKEQPTQNNGKKQRALKNLSEDQKTKLGRAKRVLGKADRATAGNQIVEGTRAKKGDAASGIKSGKNRVKKPRIRQRSSDFKKARSAVINKK